MPTSQREPPIGSGASSASTRRTTGCSLAASLRRRRGLARTPALFAELAAASQKLALLGQAGLIALDLLERGRGDAAELDALLDAAAAIPIRVGANDFPQALAPLLSERSVPDNQDVFADFFSRARANFP